MPKGNAAYAVIVGLGLALAASLGARRGYRLRARLAAPPQAALGTDLDTQTLTSAIPLRADPR